MHTVKLFFVVAILAVASAPSQSVQAAEKFVSELSQVGIDLSDDRWTLVKSKENWRRQWVRASFRDSLSIANVFWLEGLRVYQRKYETIDEWFEKKIAPRFLDKYSRSLDYAIVSKEKGQATLGSGERVTIVKYVILIEINGEYRNVRFAYFPNKNGRRWSFVFVTNRGADLNQDDAFQKVMKGITLRSESEPGQQSSR